MLKFCRPSICQVKSCQFCWMSLVQAQAARYADAAALFQALGGGWWNRQDVAPAKTWDIELIP